MRVLGAVMVGVFLAALDQTVVGTALPRIITDLGGNNLYTWAFTAYLLTSTISGPLYGKLSDLFGRRPIFLFGIGVFMVGSLLAGLSQEMWQLVAARGVQGLGAGALFPIALAVIGDLFAPSERGKLPGPVRGRVRPVRPRRPGDRRDHHRHDRLAVRVLPQPADRRGRVLRWSGGTCRSTTSAASGRRSTTSARRCSPAPSSRSSSG